MPDAPLPRRRLLLSALTNWLAFAATLVVSFFLTPYFIRTLGEGPYGVWLFVEAILAYFTLFDLGIAASVVRFVARFHAAGARDDLNRLTSSCLALFLGLGGLVFVVGALVGPLFVHGVAAKGGLDEAEVGQFLLLMLANLAASLPLGLFPSMLDGLERFTAKSAVRVVFLLLRTGGMVAALENRAGLSGLGIVYTASNLLEHAAFALLSFRYLPGLRLSWRLIDGPSLRLVKGYSLDAFLAMVAGRVSVQSGAVIIGLFLGAAEVTFFGVALRLVEFAKALLRSATLTLTPAVSSLEAAGDMDAIRRILLDGTRWVLYLILPIHVGLLAFGRPFLTIWLRSPEFGTRCYVPLAILSVTLGLIMAASVAARVLYGIGRLRFFARLTLIEAAANLAISLALVSWLGIEGVALASALPNLAFCLVVLGYTCRVVAVPIGRYVAGSWIKPLAATTVPALLWLWPALVPTSWPTFAAALTVGLVPYAVVVLVIEGKAGWLLQRVHARLSSVLGRGSVQRDPTPV